MASEEIRRLIEQNERLKDDLLILLQPQNQVSDADIRRDYIDLCDSIDFWVDNVITDTTPNIPDDHRRQVELRREFLFEELNIDPATLRGRESPEHFILSLAIQKELHTRIFDKRYPIGVTEQQEIVIDEVLEGMENQDVDKGA
jgi:hypothetical protein